MSTKILATESTYRSAHYILHDKRETETLSDLNIEIIRDKDFTKKYTILYNAFKKEKEHFQGVVNLSNEAESKFAKVLHKICNWKYKTASIELTEEETSIFKFNFDKEKILYLKIFLSDNSNEDTYFGYYIGSTCQKNGIGSLGQVISDIKNLKIA